MHPTDTPYTRLHPDDIKLIAEEVVKLLTEKQASTPAQSDLIGYDELAAMLSVKKQTLMNWASSGKLPKTYTRGKFSRKAIEQWIQMQHVPSAIELMQDLMKPKGKRRY
ncbi:helix-turn-helix domain-containing protein [Cytophagaceae bacterium YF14B1]|uniref:Helix-turn-helix domain-containing protein n=1 Tax=Xanthocytophaga flava TaxID=3048013 RepID=A0AAE3QPY1_9BACT|nr:helix-turn-helix domain-containing protein [Xanthocytophaga flavus]MDJ1483120.1 helix-turn-helix domain-containing protein [Xanthocytophaga flavus]